MSCNNSIPTVRRCELHSHSVFPSLKYVAYKLDISAVFMTIVTLVTACLSPSESLPFNFLFYFYVLSYLTLSPLVFVFLPPVITLMCCNCVWLTFPLCISVHVLCFRHLPCFLDLAYIFFFLPNFLNPFLDVLCLLDLFLLSYPCPWETSGFSSTKSLQSICLQCLHMGPKPPFPHGSGTSPGSISSGLDFDLFVCVYFDNE